MTPIRAVCTLVWFSFHPSPTRTSDSPDLPDGAANNERLEMYTAAMASVAAETGVLFVDLFNPTRELYAVIRGDVHDQRRAPERREATGSSPRSSMACCFRILRPDPVNESSPREKSARRSWTRTCTGSTATARPMAIRSSVCEAIWCVVGGQTNEDVIDRELEILDILVANRDERIQAVARGGDLALDDTNTPPFLPVVTNIPGEQPDGSHDFLGGEEAIGQMTIAEGMAVNLFASEEQFPELVNPNQSAMDPSGRLWVSSWATYPHSEAEGPR